MAHRALDGHRCIRDRGGAWGRGVRLVNEQGCVEHDRDDRPDADHECQRRPDAVSDQSAIRHRRTLGVDNGRRASQWHELHGDARRAEHRTGSCAVRRGDTRLVHAARSVPEFGGDPAPPQHALSSNVTNFTVPGNATHRIVLTFAGLPANGEEPSALVPWSPAVRHAGRERVVHPRLTQRAHSHAMGRRCVKRRSVRVRRRGRVVVCGDRTPRRLEHDFHERGK